jgi:hypothetical protein
MNRFFTGFSASPNTRCEHTPAARASKDVEEMIQPAAVLCTCFQQRSLANARKNSPENKTPPR